MRVYVGTNVEYAPYVEMGHVSARTGRRVPAQPYIQPAFNNNMTAARQIIEHYLKDAAKEFKNR
jgi:phage gpG-like protein